MKLNQTASLRTLRISQKFARATSLRRFLPIILSLAAILGARAGGWKNERVLAAAQGDFIVALAANNQLLQFSASAPGSIITATSVTGLQAGDKLVGIDFRPATGQLYALGVNGATGRLYTINTLTGAATPVGTGFMMPQSAGTA